MERLYTTTQAAAEIGVSASRVSQMIKAGQIQIKRLGVDGRSVRITPDEVARIKAEREALAV